MRIIKGSQALRRGVAYVHTHSAVFRVVPVCTSRRRRTASPLLSVKLLCALAAKPWYGGRYTGKHKAGMNGN